MRSNTARVALGIGVIVVAIALLIVLKDDGGEGTSGSSTAKTGKSDASPNGNVGKPAIPTIVIRDGKPVGGIVELSYEAGDRIRFKVDSDVGDEVHIHDYDISKDVEAGGSASFDFPATLEGVFEGELEGRKEQILELRVNP